MTFPSAIVWGSEDSRPDSTSSVSTDGTQAMSNNELTKVQQSDD
jgi:hypothetical protein